jgi:2-aminoadipate transaminase
MKTIEFTGGKLPPESLPVDKLIAAATDAIANHRPELIAYPFQTNIQDGIISLCKRRYEKREGLNRVKESEILITNGSKQGIFLVMMELSQPGDVVLTDETSYFGSICTFKEFGRELIGIPMDENGICTDQVVSLIKKIRQEGKNARIIYTIPSHHNPTGSIMPLERRKQLVEIVEKYDMILLEDDCYGDVIFDDDPVPPSLYSLSDKPEVFYLGSYSKILGPGFRLGYLFVREKYFTSIKSKKDYMDGGSNPFGCMTVEGALRDNLWEHIRAHNAIIKRKQDLVCATLEKNISGLDVSWRKPRGGIFVWIKLPDSINMNKLKDLADERAVAYSPGNVFRPDNKEIKYLRLSYAHLPLGDIEEGVKILAGCIRDAV